MRKQIRELIVLNPIQFKKALNNPRLEGWFIGQLMKELNGKANPKDLQDEVSDYFDTIRRGYDVMDWNYPTDGGVTIGPIKGVQITREVDHWSELPECDYDDDDYIDLEDRVAKLEWLVEKIAGPNIHANLLQRYEDESND